MTKADRDYFLSVGICPTCKKNKIYANEKECEACSQWRYVYNLRMREHNRNKYNSYTKDYLKERYDRLKERGLCVRCGKRKIAVGHSISRCEICLEKQRVQRSESYHRIKEAQGS